MTSQYHSVYRHIYLSKRRPPRLVYERCRQNIKHSFWCSGIGNKRYTELKSILTAKLTNNDNVHMFVLTDFVCLYTYEFWLSRCKIVRSSIISLLSLFVRLLSLNDKPFCQGNYTHKYINKISQDNIYLILYTDIYTSLNEDPPDWFMKDAVKI
jgi:hypothetical protein